MWRLSRGSRWWLPGTAVGVGRWERPPGMAVKCVLWRGLSRSSALIQREKRAECIAAEYTCEAHGCRAPSVTQPCPTRQRAVAYRVCRSLLQGKLYNCENATRGRAPAGRNPYV